MESLSLRQNCILIYTGAFAPITGNHIKFIEFIKDKISSDYEVLRAYLVPFNESTLRKKFNGASPLEDFDRKAIIEAYLSEGPDWIKPFFGLMETDESIGSVTRDII